MAQRMGKSDKARRIAFQCSCGKRLAAPPQQIGKRTTCPACGLAIVVTAMPSSAPTRYEEDVEGLSKNAIVGMWWAVGVFAVAVLLFVFWLARSHHQAHIADADQQISQAIAKADEWLSGKSTDKAEAVEQELAKAVASKYATNKDNGEAVLNQVRIHKAQRQATAIFNDAKKQIECRRVAEAISLLHKYVSDPHATNKSDAERLLSEAEIALSDKSTVDTLLTMDDEMLARVKAGGTIDDDKVRHPVLVAVRNETIKRNLDTVLQQREDAMLVEKKRREEERLAALERQRREEEQRRPIIVTSVKQMLEIHENPSKYLGRMIHVSSDISWIHPRDFLRNKKTNGFLFTWHCGSKVNGAESLGNYFGVIPSVLNYWCDTETGLAIKEKLTGGMFAYRAGLRFQLKQMSVTELIYPANYYFAVLDSIDPP
jgi:hypothetical protein